MNNAREIAEKESAVAQERDEKQELDEKFRKQTSVVVQLRKIETVLRNKLQDTLQRCESCSNQRDDLLGSIHAINSPARDQKTPNVVAQFEKEAKAARPNHRHAPIVSAEPSREDSTSQTMHWNASEVIEMDQQRPKEGPNRGTEYMIERNVLGNPGGHFIWTIVGNGHMPERISPEGQVIHSRKTYLKANRIRDARQMLTPRWARRAVKGCMTKW